MRSRRPDRRASGTRRRAARDDSTTSSASSTSGCWSSPTGAADRPGRHHGRRLHRGERGDDARDPGVGRLPRSDDPQHRPTARPAVGGQHAPREGARAGPAAPRRLPRRAAAAGDHRGHARRRDRGQRPRTASTAPGRGAPRRCGVCSGSRSRRSGRESCSRRSDSTWRGMDDDLEVVAPLHRPDVRVPADVAEEVARAHGYDAIPGRLPTAELPPYRPDPSGPRHAIRRILAGLGLDEIVTHALIGPEDLRRTRLDAHGADLVRLYNPLSVEHSILRPSMAPSLLGRWPRTRGSARARRVAVRPRQGVLAPAASTRRHASARAETAGTGRYESWELGIVLTGRRRRARRASRSVRRRRRNPEGDRGRAARRARGAAAGVPRRGRRGAHPHRHPGRTGRICDAQRPAVRVARRGAPGRRGGMGPRGRAGRRLDQRGSAARPRAGRTLGPAFRRPSRSIATSPWSLDEATPVGELLRVARASAGRCSPICTCSTCTAGSRSGRDG
jgi:hypothetical protein